MIGLRLKTVQIQGAAFGGNEAGSCDYICGTAAQNLADIGCSRRVETAQAHRRNPRAATAIALIPASGSMPACAGRP
jgi:hypothetical protein